MQIMLQRNGRNDGHSRTSISPNMTYATGLTVEIQSGLTTGELAANLKLPIDKIKLIMINGHAAT